MADSADIIEVTLADGKSVRRHHGSGFHVNEGGNLVIGFNDKTACAYAAGQWLSAVRAGNQVDAPKRQPAKTTQPTLAVAARSSRRQRGL